MVSRLSMLKFPRWIVWPASARLLIGVSAGVVIALTVSIGALPSQAGATVLDTVVVPTVAAETVPAGELLHTLGSLDATDLRALVERDPFISATFQTAPPEAAIVADWWTALAPSAQAAQIAGAPAIIGNLDGVDWGARFLANRAQIGQARMLVAAEISDHQTQLANIPVLSVMNASQGTLLREEIGRLQSRDGIYALMEKRQVLLFDPADNGRYAEVHGRLTATTKNVGVIVNGTTLNMDTVLDYDLRAQSFWEKSHKDAPGSLVTITWMGVDFPDWGTYVRDEFQKFAIDGAPALVNFVTGINRITDARITLLGHSAGGVLIGAAEELGLPADAVVLVSSPAAGPGVNSIDDYAVPGTVRYTLTASADPVRIFQDLGTFGENPADLEGIIVLDAGASPLGDIPLNAGAHDGVFDEGSVSWSNMYNVLVDNASATNQAQL